jgi:hypothetical protein
MLTPKRVLLKNGTEPPADLVVCATGYESVNVCVELARCAAVKVNVVVSLVKRQCDGQEIQVNWVVNAVSEEFWQ